MYRAIAWYAIVLGGNKQGGKLSADNYLKAIYLGSIMRRQFSGWHLFGGNYQYSIIMWGYSLSSICPRANYLGAITWEAIFGGEIILGAIILGSNCPGGNYPERYCPGGNYPGGNCPQFSEGILSGKKLSGDQLFGGQLPGGKLS